MRSSINAQILKIALPNILGNLTVPLLGIVDTVLMAYHGAEANVLIGAIGLGGIVFNALYWNLSFLRQTTTGITAQAVGAEDAQVQALTLFRGLMIALGLGLVLLLLRDTLGKLGLSLLLNTENQNSIAYARKYYEVRIWAVPAVLLLYVLQGWYYGMQNALIPMALTTILNLTNIAVSIYCVRRLGMDADGVALGTVVAQYFSLVLAMGLLLYRYGWVGRYLREWMQKSLRGLGQFFGLSGYVFGRNLMLFAVFSTFTYYSSSLGDDYFAAFQLLLQLFFVSSFAVDGFAYASEALTGKYVGAQDATSLRQSIRLCLQWGVGFGALLGVLYLVMGDTLIGLLTPDAELISIASPFVFWLSLISLFGAVAFIWDGVYIGATLALPMFVCMLLSSAVFFVVLFLYQNQHPLTAIWLAMTVYVLTRGGLLWWVFGRLWKSGRVLRR